MDHATAARLNGPSSWTKAPSATSSGKPPFTPSIIPCSSTGHPTHNSSALSHCTACKALSGSENTLNTLTHKDNLSVNKGTPKTYTYHGDSGNNPPPSDKPSHHTISLTPPPPRIRKTSKLLLLPKLHLPHLSPSRGLRR